MEAEPNYALARISLGIDPTPFGLRGAVPEPAAFPEMVEKRISTNGDQRAVVASNIASPANAIALYESGGSGVSVGSGRIYTAGHVLYNNAKMGGTDGWWCEDASTSTANPSCPSPRRQPRWRFGGKITNPGPSETWNFVGPWVNCGIKGIPSAWRFLPASASGTQFAAADYGFADFSNCVPAGVGGLPWWTASQADLRSHSLNVFGYPTRLNCPALSVGTLGDCPGGTSQVRPGAVAFPYTAGSVIVNTPVSDTGVIATGGYILATKLDTSAGDSGGPILAFDASQWWVVGVSSIDFSDSAGTDGFNHLTSTIVNFIY